MVRGRHPCGLTGRDPSCRSPWGGKLAAHSGLEATWGHPDTRPSPSPSVRRTGIRNTWAWQGDAWVRIKNERTLRHPAPPSEAFPGHPGPVHTRTNISPEVPTKLPKSQRSGPSPRIAVRACTLYLRRRAGHTRLSRLSRTQSRLGPAEQDTGPGRAQRCSPSARALRAPRVRNTRENTCSSCTSGHIHTVKNHTTSTRPHAEIQSQVLIRILRTVRASA